MIKLLAFDLDGVLVDCKDVHFKALKKALKVWGHDLDEEYHNRELCGLPTKEKLSRLGFGVMNQEVRAIENLKQQYTIEEFEKFEKDDRLCAVLDQLHHNYTLILVCCTNSIYKTASLQLRKKGLNFYFSGLYTNEEVIYPKPHPQIYMQAMVDFGIRPRETLIIEDSPIGLEAARESGAHVLKVKDSTELTYELITGAIERANTA